MCIKTLAVLAAVLASAPLAAQQPLSPGQTVTGTLDGGDPRMEDGAYYDAYVIRGRPGDRLVVRMSSEDFDTYLHWGYEDDGDWVDEGENDDSGDGTDSRLVIQLDRDGEYELRAAGFDEDEEGEYELRVSSMGQPPRPVPLRPGDVAAGELADGDWEGAEGREYHYVVRGAPGLQVTVLAESDDFDTYLRFGVWRDGELDVQAEDDDGGGGTDALLLAEIGEDAEYHIVVSAFAGEGMGEYRLAVLEGDQTDEFADSDDDEEWDESLPDELGDPDFSGEGADLDVDDEDWATDTISEPVYVDDGSDDMVMTLVSAVLDEPMQGVLDEGRARDEDGAYYYEFSYTARAGERLRVLASSRDFDAYVAVGRGSGDDFEPIVEDDDSGPDLDAELTWTVRRSGMYTIRVTSAVPEQTGDFSLELRSDR
jgi:3'-phosphoadenosine 5'-phosphosulfate sulfotransferase